MGESELASSTEWHRGNRGPPTRWVETCWFAKKVGISSFSFASFRLRKDACIDEPPTGFNSSAHYVFPHVSKFASSIQRSAQADPAPAPDGEANQKPEAVLPFFFFF